MALGSNSDWLNAFATMPNVADTSWKGNLADVLEGLVSGKLTSPGLINPSGDPAAVVTFGKAAFQAALGTPDAAGLSAAIAAGLDATTVTVPSGSYIGTFSPTTRFSVVASSVLDAPSKAAAAAKILEVAGKPAVADPLQSQVPQVFRAAFLLLTLTTMGTNSDSPTAPLTDTARAMA